MQNFNMNIENASYLYEPILSCNVAIQAVIDGVQVSVPLDPANRHYAEIMRQVEAGTLTIQEAS